MQGFNMGRYVPPEYEGTTSANKLAGKHALGARANKSSQGILTVRFEMPFPIWCSTCTKPTIIGQGVRFNAEKKKVGNYYTTPIFSFRMKHNVCGGWIEIRTDPKNTAYVVTEGAKKRDTGEGKEGDEGEIKIMTAEERERLANDAFASLEGKVEDKRKAMSERSRVEELVRMRDKDWEDPYAASRRLRQTFRVDRKVRQKNEAITEGLKDRMSLGMDLLEETEEDRRRAGFVEFGDFGVDRAISTVTSKPLFGKGDRTPGEEAGGVSKVKKSQKAKALEQMEKRRENLRHELRTNTRAAIDPFLATGKDVGSSSGLDHFILGIKRKRTEDPASSLEKQPSTVVTVTEHENNSNIPGPATRLVDYDSD
ncbi:MAG: hypothetical protein M1812_006887 [Candelaria pacifica]|nr:MAG: hypothetical protein M1812_006887 [Candelaria pacifica]